MLRLSFAWHSMASTVPICFLHLGGKVRVLPNMSTPKMSTPSMSTFKMSTPRTSTSQNVNSPKISYFAKIHCVSYFTTCQTAPQAGNFDHYQAHFHYILCGTWDGVMHKSWRRWMILMISRPTYAHIDMMTVITITLKLLHLQ